MIAHKSLLLNISQASHKLDMMQAAFRFYELSLFKRHHHIPSNLVISHN